MPSSTSAYTTILNLTPVTAIDGTEWTPVVQGGTDKRAQTGMIATFSTPTGFPYTVPVGGTGVASFTPYQLIVGGTVSSAALQQVVAGTAGQFLTYVASNSLPIWATPSGSVSSGLSGWVAYYSSDGTNLKGGDYFSFSSASGDLTLGASSLTGNLLLNSSAGGVTTLAPSTTSNTATFPLTSTILIGRDTVDTLTGKTFDTAGSSNFFYINSNRILAVTGSSGTVVLSTSPTIQNPTITSGSISASSLSNSFITTSTFSGGSISTAAITGGTASSLAISGGTISSAAITGGTINSAVISSGSITLFSSNLGLLDATTPTKIARFTSSGITAATTRTFAFPDATTTLVGSTNAQTLETKTFNTVNNTFQISSNTISTASSVLDIITSSAGALLYRSTGSTWTGLTIGTSGQVLAGGTVPQWTSAGAGTVSNVATSGLASGGAITTTGTINVSAATQAQQEATTSSTVAVTPSVQQYHPSAIKCWGVFTFGGASLSNLASYNIASVSTPSCGIAVINFTTNMGSSNYAVTVTSGAGGQFFTCRVDRATTLLQIELRDATGVNAVESAFSFMVTGDQ